MIWKKILPLIAALPILGLQACGAGVSESALEKTIAAGIAQTQTMQSGLEKGVNATLTAIAKQADPSDPDAPTATLTPPQGTVTVSVSADTWCNKGPGSIYDKIFILYVGQTAKVVGRDLDSKYWIIEKPDNPAVTCWLWGKYAVLTGDPSTLPVIAPPPTPTPGMGRVTAASIVVGEDFFQASPNGFSQTFDVTLTTDGPATVVFSVRFTRTVNDNWIWGPFTLSFPSAGTKSYHDMFNFAGEGIGHWVVLLTVTSPNSMEASTSFDVG